MISQDDERYMQLALKEAEKAYEVEEVPIGAVVVQEGHLIGRGHNTMERLNDATAHAEIIAIGAASNYLDTWRLNNSTLYVTLEPCMMCAGAIRLSRISRLVFGAFEPEAGVFGSKMDMTSTGLLTLSVTSGVLAEKSSQLLQSFFKEVRAKTNGKKRANG